MSETPKARRRKPRLRKRIVCLVLGHRWQRTSLPGYATRCRRCRRLWRGSVVPIAVSQHDLPD